MPKLHSYIVRYDSGFAPNPFYEYCTLATCKPRIRKHACIGDLIIGMGSKTLCPSLGGTLVYAMRVNERLTFAKYWDDLRFQRKKPNLRGSYRMACGDNIYCPRKGGGWHQLNSYHSNEDGSPNKKHVSRDTSTTANVLISNDFVYFGAEGPKITELPIKNAEEIIPGRGWKKLPRRQKQPQDQILIAELDIWLSKLQVKGYRGKPYDMVMEAKKRK